MHCFALNFYDEFPPEHCLEIPTALVLNALWLTVRCFIRLSASASANRSKAEISNCRKRYEKRKQQKFEIAQGLTHSILGVLPMVYVMGENYARPTKKIWFCSNDSLLIDMTKENCSAGYPSSCAYFDVQFLFMNGTLSDQLDGNPTQENRQHRAGWRAVWARKFWKETSGTMPTIFSWILSS